MTTTVTKGKTPESKNKNTKINLEELGSIRKVLHLLGDCAWSHDFLTDKTFYSSEFNHFIGYSKKILPQRKEPPSGGKVPCPKTVIFWLKATRITKRESRTITQWNTG